MGEAAAVENDTGTDVSAEETAATEQVDAKARKMGWVPKDEWKGNPDIWRPAQEFVERGENIVPILKDRITKLEDDFKTTVSAQKRELARVKDEQYERAKKEYDDKLKTLDDREVEAFGKSDAEEFQAVKKDRENLKPPEKPKEGEGVADGGQPGGVSPVFEDWNSKNKWYAPDAKAPSEDADIDLTLFANAVGGEIQVIDPGLPEAEFFKKVEARVKKTFPHKFKNKNRENASMAESGTHGGGGSGGKKTFADLPKEAKSAFNRAAQRVKSAGGELKKEDYVKDYFSE